MAWTADGRWKPEDDSVATRLTGMLATNDPYMQTARAAGARTASRRGLLNSSIAAGAAESAAISAAAPIASQDAQQTFQRNQAMLEGNINLDNTTKVNQQQFGYQEKLQGNEIASNEKLAVLKADTDLTQTQIAASGQLTGQYLDAFGQLAANKDIPAATRNAYITHFQQIAERNQALFGVIKSTPLNWNGGGTAPGTAPAPGSAPPTMGGIPPYTPPAAPTSSKSKSGSAGNIAQTLLSPISTKTGRKFLTGGVLGGLFG